MTCASGLYNAALTVRDPRHGRCTIHLVSAGVCPRQLQYQPGTQNCREGALPGGTSSNNPATSAPKQGTLTTTAPQNGTLTKKITDAILAVQNTCKTGNLYNYATAASPTNAGTATLSNPVNTAGILNYAALPGGYTVLSAGTKIANEAATTRGAATPIYYQLKISQNGLLSLSYATCPAAGCGAWQSVLTKQNITNSNGPLPTNLRLRRFHRRAAPTSTRSCVSARIRHLGFEPAGASEKQSAKR